MYSVEHNLAIQSRHGAVIFNHIGPGQRADFVVSGFAKQIMEIKKGRRDPVVFVGNIDVTRDFTDVRDIVQAYKTLVEHGENGEVYNICSGREFLVRDVLTKLVEIAEARVTIEEDPGRFRAAEQQRHVGSYLKLHRAAGWRSQFQIDESLRDILDYWGREIR